MEANRDIVPDYRADMCPKTLDLLARTVYLPIKPDWSTEECDALIAKIKNAI
jgi:dTDP-4-amino-4,6-dideoxygalactose transaminase